MTVTASTVTASITVDAPASAVFDVLADPRRHQEIDGSGTLTGSVTGPDRLGLGSRFGMSMKQGAAYKVKNKVVEFENDKLIAWKHFAPHVWRYELSPEGSGAGSRTKVTETWDISGYPHFARPVLNAIFAKKTQQGLEQTLVKLKAAVEKS